jgi:hypothetical protein
MTKIEIFTVYKGSIGWEMFENKVNKFMEMKTIVSVLQSVMDDQLIITVVYRE